MFRIFVLSVFTSVSLLLFTASTAAQFPIGGQVVGERRGNEVDATEQRVGIRLRHFLLLDLAAQASCHERPRPGRRSIECIAEDDQMASRRRDLSNSASHRARADDAHRRPLERGH